MKTLNHGEREFNKVINRLKNQGINVIDGKTIFNLYETYGFPPEVTKDLAQENGFKADLSKFDELFKEHQDKSRMEATKNLKGA